MKEYRVLQIYSGNLWGGIESLLVTLAKSRPLFPMIDRSFALCFHGRLRDELLAAGASVFDLGPVRFSRPWTLWRARSRLKRLLRDIPFDAVMTHACWPHAAFAPVVKRSGTRLAMSIHDQLSGKPWIERLARRTSPDMMISNSHFSAVHARAVFPDAPMRVVYHPVPTAPLEERARFREQVRAELGTPRDRVVFLQACRLERWKGQSVHVAALAALRDVPGWEAWFAGGVQKQGEREFLDELQAAAAKGGIADRIRFLGQRSDVQMLMAAADVYCQPNLGPEPFGMSFVEALAMGLPVVTSNIGGGAEIVTPACGLLTPVGDDKAVAESLHRLLKDPAYRHSLSEAGPSRAVELCDVRRQVARRAVLLLGDRADADLREAADMQTFDADPKSFV